MSNNLVFTLKIGDSHSEEKNVYHHRNFLKKLYLLLTTKYNIVGILQKRIIF